MGKSDELEFICGLSEAVARASHPLAACSVTALAHSYPHAPQLPPPPCPLLGWAARGLRGASSLAAASGSQQSAGDSHGYTGQADKATPCQGPSVSVSSLLYPQGLELGLAPGRFPA